MKSRTVSWLLVAVAVCAFAFFASADGGIALAPIDPLVFEESAAKGEATTRRDDPERTSLVPTQPAQPGALPVVRSGDGGPVARSCPGIALLVAQGADSFGYFYGGFWWPEMTAALDSAAATVTVVPNLEDFNTMLWYDALWVDQRWTGGSLSVTEQNNIAAFINTGRKVVMIGENNLWTVWNGQILGLVGGTYSGGEVHGLINTAMSHELTGGVSQVWTQADGVADTGTSLFDQRFATLWGDSALVILGVNPQDSMRWGDADNATFFTNVADWTACDHPRTPAFPSVPGLLHDNGDSDGTNGYSNAVEAVLGSRRTLLDDFVVPGPLTWTLRHFEWLHCWDSGATGLGTGAELLIYENDPNGGGPDIDGPGASVAAAVVSGYGERPTGRNWLGHDENASWIDFYDIVLSPGRYWIEWTIVGPENNFAMVKADMLDNECWVNFDDMGGLMPGSALVGAYADLAWALGETWGIFADGFESGDASAWSATVP